MIVARDAALLHAFDPSRGPGRLLRISLALIALLMSAKSTLDAVLNPLWGVDVVVPVRAAERWLAGGQPYLASSFAAGPGYDVPYLYPPLLLPFFAPLTRLPISLVIVAASAVCVFVGYLASRRLGMRPLWIPLVMLWPLFSGAITGGSLQLPVFAASVYLYWRPTADERPAPPADRRHQRARERGPRRAPVRRLNH